MKNKFLVIAGVLAVILVVVNVFASGTLSGIGAGSQQAATLSALPNPIKYWQFESSSTPNNATYGTDKFSTVKGSGQSVIDWVNNTGCGRGSSNQGCGKITFNSLPDGNSISSFSSPNLTIELLFKSSDRGDNFNFFRNSSDGGYGGIVFETVASPNMASVPNAIFSVNGNDLVVPLDGINGKDWSNIIGDNKWHHYAFVFSSTNQYKAIYIDGQLIGSRTDSGTGSFSHSGNFFYTGGNYAPYRMPNGLIDEFAITTVKMDPAWIYQHYLDTIVNGGSYSFSSTTAPVVPNPLPTTTSYDPMQFPPNYNGGSPTNASGQPEVIDQLRAFPTPRFGSNTMPRNFPWFNYKFVSGWATSGTSHTSTTGSNSGPLRGQLLQKELASSYNYMYNLPLGNGTRDCYAKMLVKLANDNPTVPIGTVTYRPQPSSEDLWMNQNLANEYYLQNSSGSFLNVGLAYNSNAPSGKYWRPTYDPTGSSTVSAYQQTGLDKRYLIQSSSLNTISDPNSQGGGCDPASNSFNTVGLNRPIALLNENGEDSFLVPSAWRTNSSSSFAAQDPVVTSQKNSYTGTLAGASSTSSGSTWTYGQFVGEMFKKAIGTAYRDKILSPNLTVNGNTIIDANTKYTEYGLDGFQEYRYEWGQVRGLNTLKDSNGSYYSTPDFYPRYPDRWFGINNANHGLMWLDNARAYEISKGDQFFSPYVSPGWEYDQTPQNDIRPAQWLGLMKILGGMGAKFYYTAFFDVDSQNRRTDPRTYIWEYAVPSYAQATMSKWGSYNSSTQVVNTASNRYYNQTQPTTTDSLFLATGDIQVPTVARKSGSQYLIATAWEQNHNMTLPANRKAKNVTVNIDGDSLTFETRVQGSTYVYDKSNTSAPVFYQLDGWHEYNGPWYWSSDSYIEAENFDSGSTARKTEGAGVATKNFTPGNYDTYVAPASGNLTYKFQSRDASGSGTSPTLYMWYRARSANGSAATASVKVDSGSAVALSTSSSTYGWCNKNSAGQVISFPGVSRNTDHTLTFTGANANFYFDQFVITTNPSLGLGNCTGGGGTSDTVSPTISITSPATTGTPNTYATSTSPITISGSASDNVGVSQITWNNNTTGQSGTATGTTSWTVGSPNIVLQSGVNTVVFTAFDAAGNSTSVTATITYTPADTTAPSVAIATPVASGGTYTESTTSNTLTTLAGTASDNVGVTTVTWSNSLGGSGTATGTTSWTVPSLTLANGVNVITVTAKDAANNIKTASITVNNDSQAPTVSMTAPANGATISTSTVTLTASATDNKAISYVEFYRGTNTLVGTVQQGGTGNSGNNYSFTWTPSANGSTALYAKAYDTSGNMTQSSSVTVTISVSTPDTIAPDVTMVNPSAGAAVSGSSVTLGAVASDNVGVSQVAFYVDGTAISGAVDTTGNNPNTNNTGIVGQLYEVVWDTTSVSNGTHTLTAVAKDAANNSTTSSSVSVTVANGSVDLVITNITTTPTSPTVGSNVKFIATVKNQGTIASPANTIMGVVFSVDGVSTSCTDSHTSSIPAGSTVTLTAGNTSSATNNWCNNTLSGGQVSPNWVATVGTHTIEALVDDINRIAESNETNNTYSKPITIAGATDTTSPNLLTITSPLSTNKNASHSTSINPIVFSGTARDNIGVAQITWANNKGGSGSIAMTPSPNTIVSWTLPGINLVSGSNIITIKAVDAAGNAKTLKITVNYTASVVDTIAPTLAITTPTSSATYTTTSATLATLSGTSSDSSGIQSVTWSNNRGGSGTANGTTSWSVSGVALQSGVNILTVVATDASANQNITTKTLTVTYNPPVATDIKPPILTITSPADRANVSNTSPVTFVATATDDVAVTQVKFFLGATSGTPKCTLTPPATSSSTYSCSFKVPSVFWGLGYSTINVQASDAAGNVTTESIQVK